MDNNATIEVGNTCQVIIKVWREDELPTFKNYYEGKITEVIERSKNSFYVRLENLDYLIPVDRVVNTTIGKLI